MCIGFILPIVISCPFPHIEGLLCRFRPAETYSSFETRPENTHIDGENNTNNYQQPFLPSNSAPVHPLPHPIHHHQYQHYQHSNLAVPSIYHNNNDRSSSEVRARTEEPSSQSSQQQMSVLTYQELSPRSSVPVPTPAPVSPAKDRIRPVTGNIASDVRHSCDQSQNDRNGSFIRTSGTVAGTYILHWP